MSSSAKGRRGGKSAGRRGGRGGGAGRGGKSAGRKVPLHKLPVSEQPRGARNQPSKEAIEGGYVYKPIISNVQEKETIKTGEAGKKSQPIAGGMQERRAKGIASGESQALVCQGCMDKYTKAETTKTVEKTQTVTALVQLSAGGARPQAPKEVKVVEEEVIVPGFRFCMKCFPETAKEMPKSEDNMAYHCKKCTPLKNERCCKCDIPLGGKAGRGGAQLCNRHAEPRRCMRCGEP